MVTPAVEFQPLVVLGAPEQRLQLLVRRIFLQTFLQDLDGFLLLASLVLDPGVDRVEQGLALVSSHRAVEHLLHLLVLLAAEEDGAQHGLRQPQLDHRRGALAQMRLRLVVLLLHVEQHADVRVQAGGDAELPAREREGVLQSLHRPLGLARLHRFLRRAHHRLELFSSAPGEQDVRGDRRDYAGKDGPERMRDAGQVEGQEAEDAGGES